MCVCVCLYVCIALALSYRLSLGHKQSHLKSKSHNSPTIGNQPRETTPRRMSRQTCINFYHCVYAVYNHSSSDFHSTDDNTSFDFRRAPDTIAALAPNSPCPILHCYNESPYISTPRYRSPNSNVAWSLPISSERIRPFLLQYATLFILEFFSLQLLSFLSFLPTLRHSLRCGSYILRLYLLAILGSVD